MPKPVADWTEDDVLALPPDENDTFERKGAKLLDLRILGVTESDVLNELAKQLSAFANTGGGQIIYGLNDAGAVDNGGIARSVKGTQSTKDWIETIIPTLTDFEIVGCNVYPIPPKATGSSLAPNKSLYVVDVPDSERAPHQSKRDFKYYVRLGGNSLPASHRLIEDIRNRAKHPRVEIHDLRIASASLYPGPDQIVGRSSSSPLHVSFAFGVRNVGMVRASSACLRIAGNIPFLANMVEGIECLQRSAPQGIVLIELKNPLYPGMGVDLIFLVATPAKVEADNVGASLTLSTVDYENVRVSFTIFADSAPAHQQDFNLAQIDTEHHLIKAMNEAVRRIRDRNRAMPPFFDPSS